MLKEHLFLNKNGFWKKTIFLQKKPKVIDNYICYDISETMSRRV